MGGVEGVMVLYLDCGHGYVTVHTCLSKLAELHTNKGEFYYM